MAGNRFTQRRVQDKYEALSMNEMLTPINAMQQKHNNLSDNTGVLSDSMDDTKQLPIHDQMVRETVDGLNSQINGISDRLSTEGYSSDLFQELKAVKRERDKAFSSTGKIGMAERPLAAFNLNKKGILANNKINPQDQQAAIKYASDRYNKNAFDDEGNPAEYQDYLGANSVVFSDEALKAAKEITPQTIQEVYPDLSTPDNGKTWYTKTGKKVTLDPEDIHNMVLNNLNANSEVTAYRDFKVLTGTPEEEVNAEVDAAAWSAAELKQRKDRIDTQVKAQLNSDKAVTKPEDPVENNLVTALGGGYTVNTGDKSKRNQNITDLLSSDIPTDRALGERLQEDMDKLNKEYTDPTNKKNKRGINAKDKLDELRQSLENAKNDISTMLGDGKGLTNDEAMIKLFEASLDGKPEEEKIKVLEILNKHPKLRKKIESYGTSPGNSGPLINKPGYAGEWGVDLTASYRRGNTLINDYRQELIKTQEEYDDGFNKYISEQGDFEEIMTEIRPQHGNFADVNENVLAALASDGNSMTVVSANGKAQDATGDKTWKDAFANGTITSVTPLMFIDKGDFGKPVMRVEINVKGTGQNAAKQQLDLQLNHTETSGVGISYVESILRSIHGVRNKETGKFEVVQGGPGSAQNMIDDIDYFGLYATGSEDKDQTKILNDDDRFGVEAVKRIKQKLGMAESGKINVYKFNGGYGVNFSGYKSSNWIKQYTIGDARKIDINPYPNAKDDTPLTFSNQGTAFKFLQIMSEK